MKKKFLKGFGLFATVAGLLFATPAVSFAKRPFWLVSLDWVDQRDVVCVTRLFESLPENIQARLNVISVSQYRIMLCADKKSSRIFPLTLRS